MPLQIAALNSGSNGNCYYIGNDTDAVFVDNGISCREVERRMKRLGLPLSRVKAIFISHEHTDHISGVPVLSHKYNIPVYITDPTRSKGKQYIPRHLTVSFKEHEPVEVGTLSVMPFSKYHDAADPYSFTVTDGEATMGVFTDLGRVCDNLVRYFRLCDAAFLEANYDTDMLANGRYPYFLKSRISGGHGHLSNTEALNLFCEHKRPHMSHLVLSHLSKENNCPKLVHELFSQHAGNTEIVVASRYEESAVYTVSSNKTGNVAQTAPNSHKHVQLTMF